MKEVKSPKKPLIYYYGIALLIILLFNLVIAPILVQGQVVEVDYGTFMDMIEEKDISSVQVEETQIIFTDKDEEQIYKTGVMEDPTLTERLHDSGAQFTKYIQEPMSPLMSIFLTLILPMLIFIGLGQYMSKKLMDKVGGKNSMSFGKSNAKIYVQSTQGIHFSDVAGEANVPFFSISGSEFVEMFVGMGASKYVICLNKPKKKHLVSYLLMKLMPSVRNVIPAAWTAMMNVNRH